MTTFRWTSTSGPRSTPGDRAGNPPRAAPARTDAAAADCLAEGTRLLTAHGDTAVERLHAGDRIRTAFGECRPVVWIGRRAVDCLHHPRPACVLPVRICADAFGIGRPNRDLLLSPEHAVFVDDVLIPIRLLANGVTIRQEPAGRIIYYHVELESHDVLLAEALAVESYRDSGNREAFANGGPVVSLHPAFDSPHDRLVDLRATEPCAPLVRLGPALERTRLALQQRASLLPSAASGPTLGRGGQDRG